ncbi:MAG: hypothetical protein S4CHLAM102_16380 [Chlamydiia bacterium]|nr:hypothetical protein [Chlamydiia bacterium]
MGLFILFGGYEYIWFEKLKTQHLYWKAYAENHPIKAVFGYMGGYILIITLMIPGAFLLSLLGGFIFPFPFSSCIVVCSATIGAALLFLATRYAFGSMLRNRGGERLQRIGKEIEERGAHYLLFLRLVPIFPFWLINIAPAFFTVRTWTFIWTTFVGIIPGTLMITYIGRRLGEVLSRDEGITFWGILNLPLILALIALGILSLLPIFFRRNKGR